MNIAAGATASPWPTLWAAAIGAGAALIVGILTQLWSGHLLRQQLDRAREDRREQWQREDSLRWLQSRQQAYARLMAALTAWDSVLHDVAGAHVSSVLDAAADAEAAALLAAAEALAFVEFMAPPSIALPANKAIQERRDFWDDISDAINERRDERRLHDERVAYEELVLNRSWLRDAMRRDVGQETGAEATQSASG